MVKSLPLALLALLLCGVFSQVCNQQPQPSDLLQSGTIEVPHANPATNSLLNSYNVPINYAVPSSGYQATAAISDYLVSNSFNYAFDFSVRAGNGGDTTAKIILIIGDNFSWTKVTINYLITSRTDLVLGHFIAEALISQSSGANQLTFNYGIPGWQSTVKQVTSVAQFAGLRTTSSLPFSLKFTSSNINTQTGQLSLGVSTNVSTPFDSLHIAYFWWTVGPTLSFRNFDPTQSLSLAYKFVGLEQINNNQLTFEGSGFNHIGSLDCVGNGCSESCVTPLTCQQLGGVIGGSYCYICGAGFEITAGQCVPIVNNCPDDEEWSSSSNKCVCVANFYRINGVCVECPENEVWDGQECACEQGYTRYGTVCSICPPNAIYLAAQNQCQCVDTYFPINGECVQCDPNSEWDGSVNTCRCKAGYYGDYIRCYQCHSSCSTCSAGGDSDCITCSNGQNPSGGSCSIIIPTPTPSILAITGTVVGNGAVYQGVSLSSVPLSFLINDCVDCADLLRVNVIAQGVTIQTSVSYVRNSQYWFIIEFNYADTGLTPVFQYTVQINPIHAASFRQQDIIQKKYQTIDPVNIPQTQGTAPPSSIANGGSPIVRSNRLAPSVINGEGDVESLPILTSELFPSP